MNIDLGWIKNKKSKQRQRQQPVCKKRCALDLALPDGESGVNQDRGSTESVLKIVRQSRPMKLTAYAAIHSQ